MSQPAHRLLQLSHLSVEADGRQLLHHIDMALDEREIVTLMGPNGAGKTTVLRSILGLHLPASGEIYRREGLVIGYVPQHFNPPSALPMTAEAFVQQGHPAASRQALSEALELTRADSLRQLPLARLSGGERQRVLLARAILRRPHLLLLDEPVQGVDLAGQVEFYQRLGTIRDQLGAAVLLVSHDLHWVMGSSDRVLCINGHICCQGRPEDVREHPEFIQLFGQDVARQIALYSHHHDHRHAFGAPPAEVTEPTPHLHGPGCRHD